MCRNPARKDAADRAKMTAELETKLKGAKSLLANRGYCRYLKPLGKGFQVDLEKAKSEEKFDGFWVLRTNAKFTPEDAARRYKQLWQVEQLFRTAKSLLDTRPIFHYRDETIRGHVFCSFLALILQLLRRMQSNGINGPKSCAT